MSDTLSLAELAARTGLPEEELRRWIELGLIAPEGAEYGLRDVERVRLVQLILRRGIDLDAIARKEREAAFLDYRLDTLYPRGIGPRYSLEAAAERSEFELADARRIWRIANLGDETDELDRDDVAMLQGVKRALDAGFPEEAVLQVLRVYADAIGRAAEAGSRAFHFYVHEPLRARGLSSADVSEGAQTVRVHTRDMVEPTVLYFLRKAQARADREDMVLHVAEDAGLVQASDVPGQLERAIVFIDLSSFTPLAEAMGDVKAAEVLGTFSLLVRDATRRLHGQVVKQIGDAFMLVFPHARHAVAAALEIEARAAEEPQFPSARSGIHSGEVLYREGDYVGANVNMASRVAGEAERHQTLVTAVVRNEAKDLPDVEFVRLGKRSLKGVAREIELFVAQRVAGPATQQAIDPVCGMELGADEVAARLTLEGVEHAFCSDNCLRQFVAAPEQYS